MTIDDLTTMLFICRSYGNFGPFYEAKSIDWYKENNIPEWLIKECIQYRRVLLDDEVDKAMDKIINMKEFKSWVVEQALG